MDIRRHEIHSQHPVENRQQDETHADLNKPTPKPGGDHHQVPPKSAATGGRRGRAGLGLTLPGQHQNQYAPHNERQNEIEGLSRQFHPHECAGDSAGDRTQRQRQDHA